MVSPSFSPSHLQWSLAAPSSSWFPEYPRRRGQPIPFDPSRPAVAQSEGGCLPRPLDARCSLWPGLSIFQLLCCPALLPRRRTSVGRMGSHFCVEIHASHWVSRIQCSDVRSGTTRLPPSGQCDSSFSSLHLCPLPLGQCLCAGRLPFRVFRFCLVSPTRLGTTSTSGSNLDRKHPFSRGSLRWSDYDPQYLSPCRHPRGSCVYAAAATHHSWGRTPAFTIQIRAGGFDGWTAGVGLKQLVLATSTPGKGSGSASGDDYRILQLHRPLPRSRPCTG